MKLLLSMLLILSVLAVGISQVEAEIATDKNTYMLKDTVIVTGNLEIPKGNNPLILVEIIDLQGNRIGDESLTDNEELEEEFHIDPNTWVMGEYVVRIAFVHDEYVKDDNNQLQRTGELIRLGNFEETISFQVTASTPEPVTICSDGDVLREDDVCVSETSTGGKPTTQDKINDLNEAEKRIKELETRVNELENEKSTLEQANEELQKQVDFLQEQLDNISKQFTNSVTQLNEWFVGKVTELQN